MHRFTVWRYLSLEKFEWLLADNGLYFSRADQQEDPDEGGYHEKQMIADLNSATEDKYLKENVVMRHRNIRELNRRTTYLSCWHKNSQENQTMWDKFAPEGADVVIQSNLMYLITQIPKGLTEVITPDDCDYDKSKAGVGNQRNFKFKDEKYAPENEFRLYIDSGTLYYKTNIRFDNALMVEVGNQTAYAADYSDNVTAPGTIFKKNEYGLVVAYNLQRLINSVHTSPNATEAQKNHIRQLLHKAGLDIPVVSSSLQANPIA